MIPNNTGKTYRKHDKELIKDLARIMCTYEEIGEIIGITGEGVKKRFKKVVEEGRAEGKKSLRRAQFEKALAGDVRMQIWLGRQYLDQKDDPNSTDNSQVLPWQEDE
jgi:hypothetical protein